jgi:hypothetical protein
MVGTPRLDCEPLAAYDTLFDRFKLMAGEFALALSDSDLRLAAWIALDELLARLTPGESTQAAILRKDLPDPTPEVVERAMALAATVRVRLVPPDDAPQAIVFAYRVAEALLTAIWAGTTVH